MKKKRELPKGMHITVGDEIIQVLMQDHFWNHTYQTSRLHNHRHSEVHLVLSGRIEYRTPDNSVTLHPGDMVIFPPETMHDSRDLNGDSTRITFQITKQIPRFTVIHPGESVFSLLENSISLYLETGTSISLGACLVLICSFLPNISGYQITLAQDQKYLIDRFLSRHYNEDITLEDIAFELNVSKKHALKLVQKYTGHNFRTELRKRRVEVAQFLLEHTDMSLSQIAEHVGYKSYNGLWQALRAANNLSDDAEEN